MDWPSFLGGVGCTLGFGLLTALAFGRLATYGEVEDEATATTNEQMSAAGQ